MILYTYLYIVNVCHYDFNFVQYRTNTTSKVYAKVLVLYMIQKTLWLWLVIMIIPLYHIVPTQLQNVMLESLYDT